MLDKIVTDRFNKIIARCDDYENVWFCYRDCKKQIIEAQEAGEMGHTPKEYQECIRHITNRLRI